MAAIVCDSCGTTFEANHPRARWCSDRCRKRGQRAEVVPLPTAAPSPMQTVGSVEQATRVALEDAERLDSPMGQAALVLARRIDSPGLDTGSSLAGMVRQLEATLATATRGAAAATSPQQLRDELAQRRAAHGA